MCSLAPWSGSIPGSALRSRAENRLDTPVVGAVATRCRFSEGEVGGARIGKDRRGGRDAENGCSVNRGLCDEFAKAEKLDLLDRRRQDSSSFHPARPLAGARAVKDSAEIVVAGAGPVGLMLGSELRRRGVDV